MKKFLILDRDIEISGDLSRYNTWKGSLEPFLNNIFGYLDEAYVDSKDLEEFSKLLQGFTGEWFAEIARESQTILVSEGVYDYTLSDLVSLYVERSRLAKGILELKSQVEAVYEEYDHAVTQREMQKYNRGRYYGKGKGIVGAVTSMALAGTANLVSDAAHSIADSAANRNAKKLAEKKLGSFLSEEVKEQIGFLALDDLNMCQKVLFEIIFNKGFISRLDIFNNEEVKKQRKILQNLLDGMIPKDKFPDLIPDLFKYCAHELKLYEAILYNFGDKDGQLQALADENVVNIYYLKAEIAIDNTKEKYPDFAYDPPKDLDPLEIVSIIETYQQECKKIHFGCEDEDPYSFNNAIVSRWLDESLTVGNYGYKYENVQQAHKAYMEYQELKRIKETGDENEFINYLGLNKSRVYVFYNSNEFIDYMDRCVRTFEDFTYTNLQEKQKAVLEKKELEQAYNAIKSQSSPELNYNAITAKDWVYKSAKQIQIDAQATYLEYLFNCMCYDVSDLSRAKTTVESLKALRSKIKGVNSLSKVNTSLIKEYSREISKNIDLIESSFKIRNPDFKRSYIKKIISNFKSNEDRGFYIQPISDRDFANVLISKFNKKFKTSINNAEVFVAYKESDWKRQGILLLSDGIAVVLNELYYLAYDSIRSIKSSGIVDRKIVIENMDGDLFEFELTNYNYGADAIYEILESISSLLWYLADMSDSKENSREDLDEARESRGCIESQADNKLIAHEVDEHKNSSHFVQKQELTLRSNSSGKTKGFDRLLWWVTIGAIFMPAGMIFSIIISPIAYLRIGKSTDVNMKILKFSILNATILSPVMLYVLVIMPVLEERNVVVNLAVYLILILIPLVTYLLARKKVVKA